MKQEQFLNLASAEEALKKFRDAVNPAPLGEEQILLKKARGRVLSRDVIASINVPFYDRSNFDGYAVRAEDTFGAEETEPLSLKLNREILACGVIPEEQLLPGTATPISTGGVLPRGADGVVMIENTHPDGDRIRVLKPIVPGGGVSLAGSDLGAGEVVLRRGDLLGFRETGTLAAVGETHVWVWKKPKVAVVSTGDELIAPGETMQLGRVYDSNSLVVGHAAEELGCQVEFLGIVRDDEKQLEQVVRRGLEADMLLLSGGTSKGEGDQNYRVFAQFKNPGILVHGVSLKPGKPLCLAVLEGTPAAILPGFPTSAIFTFTRFIDPVLREMAGLPPERNTQLKAKVPLKIQSDKGRTEFNLIHLTDGPQGKAAYSTGKGSGSVTGFSRADGFMEIEKETEMIEAGEEMEIQLLGDAVQLPDLMIIGSHCVGMDFLLGEMRQLGYQSRFIPVGSMGGVLAARRGECDLAGTHLMDEASGVYNEHLLTHGLKLVKAYRRGQGFIFREDDPRFEGFQESFQERFEEMLSDPELRMINRNRGSGTRVLIDGLLGKHQPQGFLYEAKSHQAVAAAVAQSRADWGVAIRSVAEDQGLGFIPLQDEEYDFIIPESRLQKPAVQALIGLLDEKPIIERLEQMGLIRNPGKDRS